MWGKTTPKSTVSWRRAHGGFCLHWKMKREYGKIAVALTVQVVMVIIVIMGAMRAM